MGLFREFHQKQFADKADAFQGKNIEKRENYIKKECICFYTSRAQAVLSANAPTVGLKADKAEKGCQQSQQMTPLPDSCPILTRLLPPASNPAKNIVQNSASPILRRSGASWRDQKDQPASQADVYRPNFIRCSSSPSFDS